MKTKKTNKKKTKKHNTTQKTKKMSKGKEFLPASYKTPALLLIYIQSSPIKVNDKGKKTIDVKRKKTN